MDILLLGTATAVAAGLTLFSGFGLGTLLLPVFALFVPMPAAVALTAVVHLLNNLFKLALLGRHADRRVVWRFGAPALVGAWVGARWLIALDDLPALATYQLFGAAREVLPVNAVVAGLMMVFALAELRPAATPSTAGPWVLPLGGVVSGLFGGLSGHQGAFRSAALAAYGVSKETFLGTGIVIACLVDTVRLTVYGGRVMTEVGAHGPLVAVAVASAFGGVWVGARLLPHVAMPAIRRLVAIGLILIAVGLAGGWL
ncbi:MAG: hypothetical protein A3C53_03645 [Omnitrophica WOR_2 bacterium RIFCSPHIGHO2_02_FULL_68_15]|nr:MAG: hypothetical protein A3C53_03645 [Omnitrophica WOR_2 bacterium RIFCSPHIGHO2_02_FULL_68_15]